MMERKDRFAELSGEERRVVAAALDLYGRAMILQFDQLETLMRWTYGAAINVFSAGALEKMGAQIMASKAPLGESDYSGPSLGHPAVHPATRLALKLHDEAKGSGFDRFLFGPEELVAHRERFAAASKVLRNLPESPDSFQAAGEILRKAGVT